MSTDKQKGKQTAIYTWIERLRYACVHAQSQDELDLVWLDLVPDLEEAVKQVRAPKPDQLDDQRERAREVIRSIRKEHQDRLAQDDVEEADEAGEGDVDEGDDAEADNNGMTEVH